MTADKPIPVPCVKASDIPLDPPLTALAADADIEQRAAWLRTRVIQLNQQNAILRAALVACTTTGGHP